MKILKANFEKTEIGLSLKNSNAQIFFGDKNSSTEAIQKRFSHFQLQRIKQTHSDIIVRASNEIVEADGHYSSDKNTALIIATADCLPVMIFCTQTKRVAAVHAGWKGVANQIVLKTLKKLFETGSSQKKFEIWIGPHILQNSFEIEGDVLNQLTTASYNLETDQFCYQKNSKFYVDLNQIVYSQILQIANRESVVNYIDIDTKTDSTFCSFRRDKDKAGRNLSFICLTN